MKNRIIIIYLFVVIIKMCSITDSSNDNNELAIGGDLSLLINIDYYSNSTISFPPTLFLGIGIPISYDHYFNNIGIGFTYKPGVYFSLANSSLNILVTNTLNFNNKFGKKGKNTYLLLEYGIISANSFVINYENSQNYYIDFGLGPNIFIGCETRLKKNFLFTFGGLVDTLIYIDNTDINKYKKIVICVGIEFRWRHYFN